MTLRRGTARPTYPASWVLVGVICGALMAWLAGATPSLPLPEGLATALIAVPSAGLLLAWWQLGPRFRHPGWLAVAWSLPLFAAPALLSGDVWAYLAQGWSVSQGADPYATMLGQAGAPGIHITGHWAETTSVYPPGSLLLFAAAWWLGGSAVGSLVALRLVFLACLVVTGWAVARIARRIRVDPTAAVWAALNPLVIIHAVGGAHNEAALVAVLALAALAATAGGWWGMLIGGALVGAAMLIKQSGAAAGLGIVAVAWAAGPGRSWAQLLWRAGGAGAAAVAVFVAGSLGSGLGFGWNAPTAGNPLMAMSNSPVSWLAQAVAQLAPEWFPPTVRGLTLVSGLLVVAAWGWLLVRFGPRPGITTGNPWAVLAGGLLAFALLGPALQPWYLTCAAPFLLLARPSRRGAWALLLGLGVAVIQLPLQIAFGVLPTTAVMALAVWALWSHPPRPGLRSEQVSVCGPTWDPG